MKIFLIFCVLISAVLGSEKPVILPKGVSKVAEQKLLALNNFFSRESSSTIVVHSSWSPDEPFKIKDCRVVPINESGIKMFYFEVPMPVRSYDFVIVVSPADEKMALLMDVEKISKISK